MHISQKSCTANVACKIKCANIMDLKACHIFHNLVDLDHCKIMLSSYVNMLAHAVLLEASEVHHKHTSAPEISNFINPLSSSWSDDPLISFAFELNLISYYNGKGKATQFCYNPEKDQLIHGNEDIYAIYSKIVYQDPALCIEPAGFLVLPSFSHETVSWLQRDFMQYSGCDTYAGITVIEADNGGSHQIETLDGIFEHLELLKLFFHPATGHPAHRLVFSSSRNPFILPKTFDLKIYNEFRSLYNDICENPSAFDAHYNKNTYVAFCKNLAFSGVRPKPVLSRLEWVKHRLSKGTVFIWHDCTPYRFTCCNLPSLSNPTVDECCPLICAEMSYVPLCNMSDTQLKGDAVAFSTRTVSPKPLRHASMVKKFGNRFEKQVVRLMTTDGPYLSPLVVDGDYWLPVPNPLSSALKGLDHNGAPFMWPDYHASK